MKTLSTLFTTSCGGCFLCQSDTLESFRKREAQLRKMPHQIPVVKSDGHFLGWWLMMQDTAHCGRWQNWAGASEMYEKTDWTSYGEKVYMQHSFMIPASVSCHQVHSLSSYLDLSGCWTTWYKWKKTFPSKVAFRCGVLPEQLKINEFISLVNSPSECHLS